MIVVMVFRDVLSGELKRTGVANNLEDSEMIRSPNSATDRQSCFPASPRMIPFPSRQGDDKCARTVRGHAIELNVKPAMGFRLPSAGVTPAPGIKRRYGSSSLLGRLGGRGVTRPVKGDLHRFYGLDII